MKFFDTTPIGRILNRFSKEIDVVDSSLPDDFNAVFRELYRIASTLIVIVYATPLFSFFIIPIYLVYRYIQKFYLNCSRELKRLESISHSPIFSCFSEVLEGVTTIRAYKCQNNFIKDNEDKINKNLSAFFIMMSGNTWLGIRLEFIGSFVILCTSVFAVLKHGDPDFAKIAALSLTYSFSITRVFYYIIQSLNFVVRVINNLETNIVSVERINEYINNEKEADRIIENNRPKKEWPNKGIINIKNLKVKYRNELDYVLKNVSFDIKENEKVGIVGRSGCGKSSLLLSLLRIIEGLGDMIIDDVDIKKIGLYDLRSKMSVIPQEPILFSGTIRSNIDPFNEYEDHDIWDTLEVFLNIFCRNVILKNQLEIWEDQIVK